MSNADSTFKRQGDTISDWETRLASIIEKTSRNLPKSNAPVTSDEQLNRRLAGELVCYPPPPAARDYSLQARNSSNPPSCAISARAATRTILAREEMTKQIESSVRRKLKSKMLDIERKVGNLQQQDKCLGEDNARLSDDLFSMTKKFDSQSRAISGLRRDAKKIQSYLEKIDRSEEDAWRCRIESDISHLVSSAELRKAVDRARLAATSAVTKVISPLQAQVECSLQTVHRDIGDINKKLLEHSPCDCCLTEHPFVDVTRKMDEKILQLRKQVMEEMDQSRRHILSTIAADRDIRNRRRLVESPEKMVEAKAVKDSIEAIVAKKLQEREGNMFDAMEKRATEISDTEHNMEERLSQTMNTKLDRMREELESHLEGYISTETPKALSSLHQQLYERLRNDLLDRVDEKFSEDQLKPMLATTASEISKNMEKKLSKMMHEDQERFNQEERTSIGNLKESIAASVNGEISNKLALSHQEHHNQIRDELLQYFNTQFVETTVKPILATLSSELSNSIRLDVETTLTRRMEDDLKRNKGDITNALLSDLDGKLSAQLRSETASMIEDEVCQRLDSRLSSAQMRPMFIEAADTLVNENVTRVEETLCETVKEVMACASETARHDVKAHVQEKTNALSTRMKLDLHAEIGRLKHEVIANITGEVSSQLREHIDDKLESQPPKVDSVEKTVRTLLRAEFIPMFQAGEVRSHLIDLLDPTFQDQLRPLRQEMQNLNGTLMSQVGDIDAIERTCSDTRHALLARYDTLEASSDQWRSNMNQKMDEYASTQSSTLSKAKAQATADLDALKASVDINASQLKIKLQDLTSQVDVETAFTRRMEEDLNLSKEDIAHAVASDLNGKLSAQLRSETASMIEKEVCQRLDSRLSPVQMRPMLIEAADELVSKTVTKVEDSISETVKEVMACASETARQDVTAQVKEKTYALSTRMKLDLSAEIGRLKHEVGTITAEVSSQLREHIDEKLERPTKVDSVEKTVRTLLRAEFIPMFQSGEVRSHLIDLLDPTFQDQLRPLRQEMQQLNGTLMSQAGDIDEIERTCSETRHALLARYDTLEASSEQWRSNTNQKMDEYASTQLSTLSKAKAQATSDLDALKASIDINASQLDSKLQDLTSQVTTKLLTTEDLRAQLDACKDVMKTFRGRVAAVEEERRNTRARVNSMEAEVGDLPMARSKPATPSDANRDPPGSNTRDGQGPPQPRESGPRSSAGSERTDTSTASKEAVHLSTASSIGIEEATVVGGGGTETTMTGGSLLPQHAAAAEVASSPGHRPPFRAVGAGESESGDNWAGCVGTGCVGTAPQSPHRQMQAPSPDLSVYSGSPTSECVPPQDGEETNAFSSTAHSLRPHRDGVGASHGNRASSPGTGAGDSPGGDSAGCDATMPEPHNRKMQPPSPDPSPCSGSPMEECVPSLDGEETASSSSTVRFLRPQREGVRSSPGQRAPSPAIGTDESESGYDSEGCDATTRGPHRRKTPASSSDPSVCGGSPIPDCIESFGEVETAPSTSSSSTTIRSSALGSLCGGSERCAPHEGPATSEARTEEGGADPPRQEESEGIPGHGTNSEDDPSLFVDHDRDDLGSIMLSSGDDRSTPLDAEGEGPLVLIESIPGGIGDDDSAQSGDDATESGNGRGEDDDCASSCISSTGSSGIASQVSSSVFSHSECSASLRDWSCDDVEGVCSMTIE